MHIFTEEINKIALSSNDDKRMQSFGKNMCMQHEQRSSM